MCPYPVIMWLQESIYLNLLNEQIEHRGGCKSFFYQEKQKQMNRVLLIWESLLPWRESDQNVVEYGFQLSKWGSPLSIYKENKTAKYCYLPIKLSKIYKWITNLLNVSHAMMVLTSLLVIEYRQKLVGTVLLSEYIPLAMWPQLLSSRDGVYLPLFSV